MKSIIRTRAMSTCEGPASSSASLAPIDAPLYNETSLKYLENQLSPESLLAMEDNSSGGSSKDETSSNAASAADWLMSDFMAGIGKQSPSSPPQTPEPTSLSPLALYPTSNDMCDVLTRTKNPVLPSVYIDNSLIVPEPSKQKYHNPHPLLSPEDMDDYYEAFMDDKDMTEALFHV